MAADPVIDPEQTVTHRTWATLSARDLALPKEPIDTLPTLPTGPAGDDLAIDDELGRGATGVVHAAWQRSLGREVALKEVRPGAPAGADGSIAQEARLLGRLEHPGVPPVHGLYQRDGLPVLVMKRIAGVTWRELVGRDDHPIWSGTGLSALEPAWRHVRIGARLCDALAYAHDHGLVHRDVKPANVMLGGYGEVILLDWGLAAPWANLAQQPMPRPVVGTPAYMSPEMADGLADPRSDVYLVGASLVHLLTGAPIRAGSNWMRAVAEVYAARAAELPDTFPAPLRRVIRAATEPDPALRPQSAADLRDQLVEALERRASLTLAVRSRARMEEAAAAEPDRRGRLLTEARFGLLQASRDLPEVRDDLRACTLAMVRHALDQGHLVSALTLADELEREEPSLAETLKEIRLSVAHQEELVRVARDLDPAVAARWRIQYLTGLAGMMTGLGVVVSWAAAMPQATGYWVAIWGSGNAAVLTLMGMVLWRGRLFANAYNRRVMFLVVIACSGVFVGRTLDAQLGTPVTHALVHDLVVLATLAAVVGVLFTRWMAAVCAICVAAAFGAAWRPEHAPALLAATVLVGGGVAIAALLAARRAEGKA